MPQGPASGHIRTARANIRLAAQMCGTADLNRLQQALELLQTTASEMQLAETGVRSGLVSDRGEVQREEIQREEVQRETALLRREVACLMRVIDGCAALNRGLGMRLGCTALTYTPGGYAGSTPFSTSACEMQG